jgi:hypothetical protein
VDDHPRLHPQQDGEAVGQPVGELDASITPSSAM